MNAFVVFVCFSLISTNALPYCVSNEIDAASPETVSKVIDGDTVELTDKRRIRLIGINAPELHDSEGNSQPFAHRSRAKLLRILESSQNQILLKPGSEKYDRYGRLLSHAFTLGGDNVSELMLLDGLAVRITVPPNTVVSNCYQNAEDSARSDNKGLWTQPGFWLKNEINLSRHARGFYIIQARVKDISKTRKSTWINLENNVSLRIAKDDSPVLDNIGQVNGKLVEARGWIKRHEKRFHLRIRHPLNLRIVE